MNSTAHASYSFFIYLVILRLAWQIWPNGIMCCFGLVAGMSPDFDGLYHLIVKKGDVNDQNFQHHLHYWTHWPSSYLPVLIMVVICLIFNFYPQYAVVAIIGPGSHLIFDSVSCGDGMMWAAAWWKIKRGEFGKFTNLDSKKTDGYHGNYWGARYRQTKYFILENIAAGGVIIILVYLAINGAFDFPLFVSLSIISVTVLLSLRGVDAKYKQEPPQGRYADYHTFTPYVMWYQKKYGTFPPKKYAEG